MVQRSVGISRPLSGVLFCGALLAVPLAGCFSDKPTATRAPGPASAPSSQPSSGPAARAPRPADRGLGPNGELRPSPADRCPVCAMRPGRNPKSAAGLALHDERTFYFCGNGCLLRAYRSPQEYLGVPRDAITRMSVIDYFRGQPLDAREAFWVAGSDVTGPMGPAIVALGSEGDADRFVKRHGGRHRFRLDDLTDSLWRAMTAHRPAGP